MAILRRLTDFAAAEPAPEPVAVEDLPGYAQGLAAGLAQAEAATAVQAAEVSHALTRLVRTEAEARRDVARTLDPLFQAICRQLLPRTAPQVMVADILAEFTAVADRTAEASLDLRVSTGDLETVRSLLPQTVSDRLHLQADPDLGPLCVVLSSAQCETIIDRGALIDRIATLFDAFSDHLTESETDG